MRRRVTGAEQGAATRLALLDAARTVFLKSGYHGTTVDAVAAEAGFTIGARALSGPDAPAPDRVEDFTRAAFAMAPGAALAWAADGEAFRDDLMDAMTAAVAARLLGARP